MYLQYFAKPWLEISVGYKAGRAVKTIFNEAPQVLNDKLATDGGYVICHACPEEGERFFKKRHTMARFIKQHRHCGKGVKWLPAEHRKTG